MFNSNASAVSGGANYIEDVFSTWLYTGNGSTQTINNGIDLAGEGGMVWRKQRDATADHFIADTVRGTYSTLSSNTTAAASGSSYIDFLADGFQAVNSGGSNASGSLQVGWTFRKQPKFFDVVTYTGTGSQQSINHALGSVPGFIIVKRLDAASSYWGVYHRSLTDGYALGLNTTDAQFNAPSFFVNSASQTATQFTVGTSANVNDSGATYVAYLFAHDAGGFGLTGTDNVISCGSYTGNGAALGPAVNLGYEPQWILVKRATGGTGNWYMVDNMRGFVTNSQDTYATAYLFANRSDSELTTRLFNVTSTGFQPADSDPAWNNSGDTYIYIAIRRGPMKVPTTGTSVFSPNAYAGTSGAQTQTTNFPVDLFINKTRNAASDNFAMDRLRGSTQEVETNTTAAESALSNIGFDSNTGVKFLGSQLNGSGSDFILWSFRRAPSFFDEVCYTGTGSATTFAHNLAAVPELMIVKSRSQVNSWAVYLGGPLGGTKTANLDKTYAAYDSSGHWNSTQPTASVFSIGNNGEVNDSGKTYVAYLFATLAGVSKVGSYTGTATTKQIDCGFTGGARFVLIKRTDSTGDWYVWDSARGIVAGNDPYLLLNSTAAEVTSTDYVDTYSAGFELTSTAPAALNASGGTYIFLAIA